MARRLRHGPRGSGPGRLRATRCNDERDRSSIADDEQNLEFVRRKFEAGKVARSDVLVAATQLASDQTQLPPLRQRLAATRHALSALAGQLPALWSPPDFELDGFERDPGTVIVLAASNAVFVQNTLEAIEYCTCGGFVVL